MVGFLVPVGNTQLSKYSLMLAYKGREARHMPPSKIFGRKNELF
jgi:hypothetical protein